MADGFFSSSDLQIVKAPISLLPKCGACGLFKTCHSPKMKPSGQGKRSILIVGEAPGADEDARGEQFVGKAGQRLRATIRKIGYDPRRDCVFTNALICRPPKNATPDDKQIGYCQPNLIKTIQEVEPEIIIPLGKTAVKSLISYLWREDVGDITRWVGWQIPCQKINTWICPAFHPSFVERENNPVTTMFFEEHLAAAFALKGPPWEDVPDYKSQVEVVLDTNKAADMIDALRRRGGVISFDFETNMLKPDSNKARIVSCAVASFQSGRDAVARRKEVFSFPMHGNAIRALAKLLASGSTKKVGANLKFEERWSIAKLGTPVKNWVWDTVVDAHVLDNRSGITAVKFQAFVLLGQDTWDGHVRKFLKTKKQGGNEENRIKDVSLNELLIYNGMDAIVELEIAQRQRKRMGY